MKNLMMPAYSVQMKKEETCVDSLKVACGFPYMETLSADTKVPTQTISHFSEVSCRWCDCMTLIVVLYPDVCMCACPLPLFLF